MSAYFVTASGTEIGKTYVTAALIRQLRDAGRPVRAFKPVASGMPPLADPRFRDSDTALLLEAQGLALDEAGVEGCTPWRFKAPLSPDMAAAAEARRFKLDEVADWTRAVLRQLPPEAVALIEGAGGAFSPIASDGLNVDLAQRLAIPAMLVCGSYLGAIGHALAAIEALHARAVALAAVVVNESEGGVDFEATLRSLARFAPRARFVPLRRRETSLPALPF